MRFAAWRVHGCHGLVLLGPRANWLRPPGTLAETAIQTNRPIMGSELLARMAAGSLGREQNATDHETAMTNEDVMRLRSRPPVPCGLVRRSPTIAPSGLVRMKAVQNSKVGMCW